MFNEEASGGSSGENQSDHSLCHSYFIMVSFGCWGRCCAAHSATLQKKKRREKQSEILHKQLLAGTFSVSICPLRCHPPAALISAKRTPPADRRLSARAMRQERSHHSTLSLDGFQRSDSTFQEVHDGTRWSVEFSCRKNEELLFCRSSVWDFTQVWTGEAMRLHHS